MDVWQIFSWFANAELGGNKMNVLGFMWLCALMYITVKRLKPYFEDRYWPRPTKHIYLWWCTTILLCFVAVWLMQLLMDDAITTPISLIFGSWKLLEPHMGPFAFEKLFAFKWDIYANIFIICLFFTMAKFWQFFTFTWKSVFWLILIIVFQVAVSASGIFGSHLFYPEPLRTTIFWATYPEFRTLTGFFVASIIRKPPQWTS